MEKPRINPSQLSKYNHGCQSVDLIFAWLDYAKAAALNRGESISTDQALEIAMQVASQSEYQQEIIIDLDGGDGGDNVTI
jgi:hypothetical protein